MGIRNFKRRVIGKLSRVSAEKFCKTPLVIPKGFKGVSFCFDDFPQSSMVGAKALEVVDARGTFYVCFDLLGKDSPSGKIANLKDVKELAERGHEIGCHTYDHLNCSYNSAKVIDASCDKNIKIAKGNGLHLDNFAYPQGGMSLSTKKIMQRNYKSARSVMAGVNRGICDAHCLNATALYDTTDMQSVLDMISDVADNGGWLIIYTHDVSKEPSKYGVSEVALTNIISNCVERSIPIKTVDEVMTILGDK